MYHHRVRFQLPPLISFGLENYYHLRVVDFIDQKLFKDDISVIFDRFLSMKCLSITIILVVGKCLVDGKLLADTNLFSVGKHLLDTKHLASIKMLIDQKDLPDLTIKKKTRMVDLLITGSGEPEAQKTF